MCAILYPSPRSGNPSLQQLRLLAEFQRHQPSVSWQPDTDARRRFIPKVPKGIEVRDLRQPVNFFTANLRSHLCPMTPARRFSGPRVTLITADLKKIRTFNQNCVQTPLISKVEN